MKQIVGVVGLPELAKLLAEAGLTVIADDRSTLRSRLDSGWQIPIVAADTGSAELAEWMAHASQQTRLVLLRTATNRPAPAGPYSELTVPASVSAILDSCLLHPVEGPAADAVVQSDGAIDGYSAPSAEPVDAEVASPAGEVVDVPAWAAGRVTPVSVPSERAQRLERPAPAAPAADPPAGPAAGSGSVDWPAEEDDPWAGAFDDEPVPSDPPAAAAAPPVVSEPNWTAPSPTLLGPALAAPDNPPWAKDPGLERSADVNDRQGPLDGAVSRLESFLQEGRPDRHDLAPPEPYRPPDMASTVEPAPEPVPQVDRPVVRADAPAGDFPAEPTASVPAPLRTPPEARSAPEPTARNGAVYVPADRPADPDEDRFAGRGRRSAATLMFSVGAKGGVGKSLITLLTAQRAAVKANIRVAVIDLNRGQGDLRVYLRLVHAALPSIYDAAISGRYRTALLGPAEVNAARHPQLDPVRFGLVLAPWGEQADPNIVSSAVYAQMIELARSVADLVIVDTQILETVDTSGLVDNLIVPALHQGAWALMSSDNSPASLDNAYRRLQKFGRLGVDRDRLLMVLNRINEDAQVDVDGLAATYGPYANLLGVIKANSSLANGVDVAGNLDAAVGEIADDLDSILFRVTGLATFAQRPAEPSSAGRRRGDDGGDRRGLLSRFRRG